MEEIRYIQRFENFKQANANLLETVDCINQNGLNKIYIMALVQSFEMCFELAWKTMKDYLEYDGITADSPRTTIKEAFSTRLIDDGQSWIAMMEARNKTSHTYKEEFAKEIAQDILNKYIPLLLTLQNKIESKING